MLNPSEWFTEQHADAGSAFSLKIKQKLHEEQSEFQHLEIYETETFGNLMIIDGCTMVSTRDNFFYHEMMSHPALFTHPDPKRVWIIGGGDCGTLREVLKHPSVEQAVQIDIDERVTRLAEIYFPELCESNNDPRADLKFIDGIKWVKDAAPNSVDIIIVDSTDPVGPALGLFSEEFYRDCFACLSENGMVVQQSESALYHVKLIGEMRAAMSASGFNNLQTLFFPQCLYPSGWWSATIASKGDLSKFREADSASKPFDTTYYNIDIHKAALAQPEFFKKAFGL
ncbi:MAG: polyamine aminopropyltransferase [Methylobacter sp.]|nr:polyamine aminopropyltransferase [Methylobacter sp.]MDP2429559.1 polyamine aminopropyltransferase [Methylobacter sp.]MDP3056760.1 polyamine aminopropyltransferase [Methylobacter sp.]MDP3360675.1 polyamine aminopropyltransferase [Methylobacter sp.]MDZ4220189.1 polyamine aminopropyltransferase [Methylobacter sp.]